MTRSPLSHSDRYNASQRGSSMVAILAIVAILALGGLGYLSVKMAKTADDVKVDAAQTSNVQNNQTADTTANQPEIKEGNPVVAKVGDEDIKRLEVLQFIQTLPAQTRQLPIDQLFPLARDQVISNKVLEKKTENVRLDNDPEVKKQVAAAKKQIVRAVYVQKQIDEKLTDERIQKQYDEIVANTPEAVEVKAAHILVDDKKTAEKVIKELQETGDFATLAKEYSKDSTAENGGELGYFTKDNVVPEFGEAAFNLEPGMYTKDPIKTEFGYHVIRVDDKRDRQPPTMEQAKPYIEANLRQQILNEYLLQWQSGMDIERLDINGEPEQKADTP